MTISKLIIFGFLLFTINFYAQNGTIRTEYPSLDQAVSAKSVKSTFYITSNFPDGQIAKRCTYTNNILREDVQVSIIDKEKHVTEIAYDEMGRIKYIRTSAGKKWLKLTKEYLQDNLLQSEFEVGYDGEKRDTFVYSYQYPNKISYPLTYYKYIDGKKIGQIEVTKQGDQEVVIKKSLNPATLDLWSTETTTKILNEKGAVLKESTITIFPISDIRQHIDTLILAPSYFEYDSYGNLTKKTVVDLFNNEVITVFTYEENKYLKTVRMSQGGKIIMHIVLNKW